MVVFLSATLMQLEEKTVGIRTFSPYLAVSALGLLCFTFPSPLILLSLVYRRVSTKYVC